MGLNIRIHDINVPSSFELFYKTGNTPGNMTVIENGYTKFGGIYPSSSSRNYNLNPIVFTGATFNTQYWFKIQYTGVTGHENSVGYIIENIKTHQPVGNIYYAIHCCDFSGGTAEFYTGCTFSGGTVVYGQSLDPTATPPATPNPTSTPTPTPTITIPGATPNPTSTPNPTATPDVTPNPTATIPGATPNPTSTPGVTPNPTATEYPGACYQLVFPPSVTMFDGKKLYICYQKTDSTYPVCWPYDYFEDSGANFPNSYTINICSKTFPSLKYGPSGDQMVPDGNFNITTGSGCISSSDCGGNDPTTPPPTATAEPILNDSGNCYRWSVDDGNNNSGITVTYTSLGTNTPYTVNVNNVESDMYYYYICSKTLPDFRQNSNQVTFPYIEDGTCSLVNGVYSGCQPPPPDATPNPTSTPDVTPNPTATVEPGTSCIVWFENTQYGLSDGCGGSQRSETTLTAQLQDGYGNMINATETIYVAFDGTYSNELGTDPTTITAVINSGSSSGVTYYYPLTYEYGPRSGDCTSESTTRNNDTPTITGSNGGTYSACPT
jgi:hypothetical protein